MVVSTNVKQMIGYAVKDRKFVGKVVSPVQNMAFQPRCFPQYTNLAF